MGDEHVQVVSHHQQPRGPFRTDDKVRSSDCCCGDPAETENVHHGGKNTQPNASHKDPDGCGLLLGAVVDSGIAVRVFSIGAAGFCVCSHPNAFCGGLRRRLLARSCLRGRVGILWQIETDYRNWWLAPCRCRPSVDFLV